MDYIRKQQVASIEKMDCGICAAAIGESIQGDNEIENGKFDIMFGSAEQQLSDRCRKALQFGALHQTKVLVSWLSVKCIRWQHDRFIYVVFA